MITSLSAHQLTLFHIFICRTLTESPVTGELLVDLFHALDVDAAGLCVVHHGLWIMLADNTFSCLLHGLWSVPGIINMPGWKSSQNGQVASEETHEEEKKIDISSAVVELTNTGVEDKSNRL